MFIYWIALALTCLFSYFLLYTKSNKNEKKEITHIRVFISFIPLFIVSILRWNVGVDVVYGTGYYAIAYNAIANGLGNIFNYEKGFYILMKLCNIFHLNLYLFYCLTTFIFFYIFTKFIAKNSKHVILSAIIFVLADLYLFTFSTLRQSLGIAFSLYPISCLLNREKYYKDLKWWIFTILALSMHSSVLYLYIILLISKVKIRKNTLILLIPILLLLSPFIQMILKSVLPQLMYFKKYFGSNMDVGDFSITYFAISLVLFIISIINYKRISEEDTNNYILINFCAYTTILMANSKLLIMPYRIFPLLVPIYIILCSKLIENIRKNSLKYVFTLICIIVPFLTLFINQYYINDGEKYFKYHSIFSYPEQVWKK